MKAFVTVQCLTHCRRTTALWKWQFPLPGRILGTSASSWACSTLSGVFLKCLGILHLRSAHIVIRKGERETDCQEQQAPWIQLSFRKAHFSLSGAEGSPASPILSNSLSNFTLYI